ncbi:MAG: pyruvate formate lyase-activating protein [Clostridia bacterium]|nr:pyruvate formate lyase-activating protein [Clostridia bacterium]
MIARVNSIQSLGTVDGPGVRFVVFLQGCNLRCKCCHNPDTWECSCGSEFTPEQIVEKAEKYKEYFGKEGGITLSGGEPLIQTNIAIEIFSLCHQKGINTCLDTSGSIINENTEKLLQVTDRVLLDIKYTNDKQYRENVGCSLDTVLEFLSILNRMKIPTTLRQVIIPTVNDNEENILKLKAIAKAHPCVDKIELLPFKKICQTKYDNMGINFPFGNLPTPTASKMSELNELLK